MRNSLLSTRLKIILAVLGLGLLVLNIGVPSFERSNERDPLSVADYTEPKKHVSCVLEKEPAVNLVAQGVGACPTPRKVNGLWDQGEGGYCYLVSVLNSNILAGVDDSSDVFYKAMRDCLEEHGVSICDLKDGIDILPGTFHVEIINGCKIITRGSTGDAIGIDFYRLKRSWWDWSSEFHELTSLCAKINGEIKNGGGAWASIGLANGAAHEVSIVKATKSSEGNFCTLVISDPNEPHNRTRLTVGSDNKIKRIEPDNHPSLALGDLFEDVTIESLLRN